MNLSDVRILAITISNKYVLHKILPLETDASLIVLVRLGPLMVNAPLPARQHTNQCAGLMDSLTLTNVSWSELESN